MQKNEKMWLYAALAIGLFIIFMGLWSMLHVYANEQHTRFFKGLFKEYGSRARLVLFFVIAHYVLKLILKSSITQPWGTLKKWIVALLKFARKWHAPAAIIAIAVICLHIVGAFIYGIKFDFSNITGLLALAALLPVPVLGLLCYKKMDRKWHLYSGVAFTLLFFIHAFL